jgi:hypothetical protein
MGKAKMYGMYKPFTPNCKEDRKRNKTFTGVHKKKGKAKK